MVSTQAFSLSTVITNVIKTCYSKRTVMLIRFDVRIVRHITCDGRPAMWQRHFKTGSGCDEGETCNFTKWSSRSVSMLMRGFIYCKKMWTIMNNIQLTLIITRCQQERLNILKSLSQCMIRKEKLMNHKLLAANGQLGGEYVWCEWVVQNGRLSSNGVAVLWGYLFFVWLLRERISNIYDRWG